MKLTKRLKSKTPRLFRNIRNIGIALAAAGGSMLTMGATLPASALVIAHYLVAAGTVAAAVSQSVYAEPKEEEKQDETQNPQQ